MPRWTAAPVALLVLALAGAAAGAAGGRNASTVDWSKLGRLQSGPPPWGNDSASLPRRLRALGLHALGQEGAVLHIHQHLDLFVAGRHVTVPAAIGIDVPKRFLTELHTHDTTGIIHVESPASRAFTLGQFFGEWGVRLSPRCVGRYCGRLQWWVNGRRMAGDPAALVLRAHQEIVVAAGPPPFQVPAAYAFPPGD